MTRRAPVLGVIADDFTGATDVASMLVRAGLRTVQVIGVPEAGAGEAPEADAVIVALKSRTTPAADAVRESLAALRWLQAAGARQFYFKVCSTFDSTPAGNIGPVTEALMDALDAPFAIACPAFPENGRTVFRGHLFVGDQLLSDTGMREHPLTPMTDANLVRVLQAQTTRRVGLLRHDTVGQGPAATRARIVALIADGVRIAIADAIDNDDLRTLARACIDLPLITAGSGVALGLPEVYAARGWVVPDASAAQLDAVGGHAAVLSGSCSTATNAQVTHWRESGRPALRIDPLALAAGVPVAADALAWARARLADGPLLVHATAAPDEVRATQSALGAEQAGHLVETCLATVAAGLHDARRAALRRRRRRDLGGGRAGAWACTRCASARRSILACRGRRRSGDRLLLALKSGNFGTVDFFAKALAQAA